MIRKPLKKPKTPDQLLGALFADVQSQRIFEDGKTFADMVPKKRAKAIFDEYELARHDPDFDMREFVSRHFYADDHHAHGRKPFQEIPGEPLTDRITRLWDYLERRAHKANGSLLPVPHPYIVPGGRFTELFYWDSYFIALGLAADERWEQVEALVKNIATLIRLYGYMPTANRTYLLSRSQPPVFSLLVQLLASHKGGSVYRKYLPVLLQEYRWWMKGVRRVRDSEHGAYRRVVQATEKAFLNRYYDDTRTPRPESLREDTDTSRASPEREPARVFLHLRAAAESGWDFSSRWFNDGESLHTIHTADLIPVDLNCLLHELELTIAKGFGVRQPLKRRTFLRRAHRRAEAIDAVCWSEYEGFYTDYNFHRAEQSDRLTLAGIMPLYAGIASQQQASLVVQKLEAAFLQPGGFVTSLHETGQQWDYPNGWAPLQWFAVQGLRRYGYGDLARDIEARFMKRVELVYKKTGRIVEKYDVVNASGIGGGGEYPVQDGFGWTNGVYQAFKKSFRP